MCLLCKRERNGENWLVLGLYCLYECWHNCSRKPTVLHSHTNVGSMLPNQANIFALTYPGSNTHVLIHTHTHTHTDIPTRQFIWNTFWNFLRSANQLVTRPDQFIFGSPHLHYLRLYIIQADIQIHSLTYMFTCLSFIHSFIHSASQSVSQSVGQSVSQSVVSQSVSQPFTVITHLYSVRTSLDMSLHGCD